MTAQVIDPFLRFVNKQSGRPIFNGEVYFGRVASDPKNNAGQRVPVYIVQNDGSELAISQPVQTNAAGYLVYNGSPVQLKVEADATEDAYCIQVFDENDVQQFYTAEVNTLIDFPTLADPATDIVIAGMSATEIVRKAEEMVTVADFGAIGDGIADDTAALNAALVASKYVIVPDGFKLRITATITMPISSTLFFQGGIGNLTARPPTCYIIKDGSLNGNGVVMQENCSFIGGGVIGQAGNLGNGIQVAGNGVFIDRVFVSGMGNDGIRIGTDLVYTNCNSAYLNKVICCKNGGQGIHVHDGFSEATASADANAGTMIQPFCYQNTGSGILMKRAWWWTVINALTEGNDAWGMFVDSTVVAPDTVARCRYIQIFGGDFNEGNDGGSLFFGGYAGCLYMSTANQVISIGGVLNNIFGGGGENINWGQTINREFTYNENQDPVTTTAPTYKFSINKPLTGTPGEGVGIAIRQDNINVAAPPYAIATTFESRYRSPGNFEAAIRVRKGANLETGLVIDPEFRAIIPGADNLWRLGTTNSRFNLLCVIHPVYANDAAAIAGGLTVGCHYHNGDGIVRMVR